MGDQSLTKQVEDAFGKLKTDGKDFLKSIQDLASKAGENVERTAILLFTLIVIFMLIDLKLVEEVTFFGLKFEDLTPISVLIPIVISYTYLDLIINIAKVERLSKIYKVIVRKIYPPLDKNNLTDYFIFIPSLLDYKYYRNEISSGLWKLFFYAIIILPLVFVGYAIWKLFILMQIQNFKLVFQSKFSIICTLLFTAQGVLTLIHLLFPNLSPREK